MTTKDALIRAKEEIAQLKTTIEEQDQLINKLKAQLWDWSQIRNINYEAPCYLIEAIEELEQEEENLRPLTDSEKEIFDKAADDAAVNMIIRDLEGLSLSYRHDPKANDGNHPAHVIAEHGTGIYVASSVSALRLWSWFNASLLRGDLDKYAKLEHPNHAKEAKELMELLKPMGWYVGPSDQGYCIHNQGGNILVSSHTIEGLKNWFNERGDHVSPQTT
jgi:hypothetical protein